MRDSREYEGKEVLVFASGDLTHRFTVSSSVSHLMPRTDDTHTSCRRTVISPVSSQECESIETESRSGERVTGDRFPAQDQKDD